MKLEKQSKRLGISFEEAVKKFQELGLALSKLKEPKELNKSKYHK